MSNEGLFDKVKDFLKGHPEQAGQGLDRAEQLIDERTGGKYSEQVARGGDMVRQQLGVDDGRPDATLPTPGTDPDVVPTPTPEVPPAPNTPAPSTPVPGPPVPTTTPETVPEAAPESMPDAPPDTSRGDRV